MRVRWALGGVLVTTGAALVVAVELIGHGLEHLARAECPDHTHQ